MKVMPALIAMVLAFVAPAEAQLIVDGPTDAQYSVVKGYLVDHDSSPLPNTVIVLDGTAFYGGQDISMTVVTDASGHFQLVDLPAGSYSLSVVTPGAEPTPVKVDAGNSLELDHGYAQVNVKARAGMPPQQLPFTRRR
jgi:hypothetical protein